MNHSTPIETEVKLRIESLEPMAAKLESAGFREDIPKQAELSVLWDRGTDLFEKGCALRLRQYAGRTWITWKGPKAKDPLLKIRPELETAIESMEAMEGILKALGFKPILRMEKQRSVWHGLQLVACLDETPFGCYLELEGEPTAIRSSMDFLELDASQAETRSYPSLFRDHGLA